MESRQKMALILVVFFIVIMVGSGLVMISFGENQQPDNNDDTAVPVEPATAFTFSSQPIDANVLELFPQVEIQGITKETNILLIDQKIAFLGELTGLQSNFEGQQGAFMIYHALVSLSKTSNTVEFSEKLEKAKVFEFAQLTFNGLLKIPEVIQVENKELEQSKEFKPKSPFAQAVLGSLTRVNDAIQAVIEVQYTKGEPGLYSARETFNPAVQPINFADIRQVPVESLQHLLLLEGKMSRTNFSDKNALEKEMLSITDINNASFQVADFKKVFYIDVKEDFSNEADLNALRDSIALNAASIPDLNSFSITPKADFTITINAFYNERANVENVQEELKQVIIEAGYSASSLTVTEFEVQFSAILELSTLNAEKAFQEIKSFFNSKGIGVSVQQAGSVTASNVFDSSRQLQFALDSNSVEAFFSKPHTVGETVLMSLKAVSQRDKIIQVNAVEVEFELD